MWLVPAACPADRHDGLGDDGRRCAGPRPARAARGALSQPDPALLRGLPLHPDDEYNPYVFRLDLSAYGIGLPRVVFSQDATGAVSAVRVDGHLLSAGKRSS